MVPGTSHVHRVTDPIWVTDVFCSYNYRICVSRSVVLRDKESYYNYTQQEHYCVLSSVSCLATTG